MLFLKAAPLHQQAEHMAGAQKTLGGVHTNVKR